MSKTNPKTLKVRSVVPGTGEQLAKVKKLITANNADSFALAVELVRTLRVFVAIAFATGKQ